MLLYDKDHFSCLSGPQSWKKTNFLVRSKFLINTD